jgi:hypothetical protein
MMAIAGLVAIIISAISIMISIFYTPQPKEVRPMPRPFQPGEQNTFARFFYSAGATVNGFMDKPTKGIPGHLYVGKGGLINIEDSYFTYNGDEDRIMKFEAIINTADDGGIICVPLIKDKEINSHSTTILKSGANILRGYYKFSKGDVLRFKIKSDSLTLNPGSYYQMSTTNNSYYPSTS